MSRRFVDILSTFQVAGVPMEVQSLQTYGLPGGIGLISEGGLEELQDVLVDAGGPEEHFPRSGKRSKNIPGISTAFLAQ